MTAAEILVLLTRWESTMVACDEILDDLAAVIGSSPEAPLQDAVNRVMGAYTKTLAEMIGWDYDTLVSWWCEHRFGEKPMQIGFAGEPLRSLDSTEALAEIIAEDLRRAA